jgi:NTE family protein
MRKSRFSALLLAALFLAACQGLKTREDIRTQPKPHVSPAAPVQAPPSQTPAVIPPAPPSQAEEAAPIPIPPPPPPMPEMPRIGVILSGGGAKTYAHIGFLQELSRLRIPIHAIAGIEFASPMAALYANKELANDVEWQMFKIKDDDVIKRSLLGGSTKPVDISSLNDFIRTNFARLKVEDFKLPFACPAYNMAKNQIYLLSRGSADALLPYCWPYPPLFKPYRHNVSAIREVKMLADFLRSKGANYILFVNAMGGGQRKALAGEADSMENIVWTEISGHYAKNPAGVDAVLSLDTQNYGIMDFEKRREIMQKGADSAEKTLKSLAKRWGL